MASVPFLTPQGSWILQHPGRFALQVLKAFRANQGLLLAGAVAYYTLLSIVPLMVLMVIAGVLGEIIILSSIYYFMPVGRMSMSHAAIGGVTAGLLWEIIRHGLAWYFSTISRVEVVYGPLTTAIVVLLSLEIAAPLLLLGAQVIAEYERLEKGGGDGPPQAMRTEAVAPER